MFRAGGISGVIKYSRNGLWGTIGVEGKGCVQAPDDEITWENVRLSNEVGNQMIREVGCEDGSGWNWPRFGPNVGLWYSRY